MWVLIGSWNSLHIAFVHIVFPFVVLIVEIVHIVFPFVVLIVEIVHSIIKQSEACMLLLLPIKFPIYLVTRKCYFCGL